MKKITLYTLIGTLIFCNMNLLHAQLLLKEIPLSKQVEKSSLIIEGKVISKRSFRDTNNNNIYTANTIKVYKSFKGTSNTEIEIITPGGSFEGSFEMVNPSLKLHIGDMGIFTLHNNNLPTTTSLTSKKSIKQYKAYSSLQGFYRYNLHTNIAVNPFSKRKGISESLYKEITSYTGKKHKIISSLHTNKSNSNSKAAALGITSFSPTTSSAGTKSELTITGTDFGSTKGKVGFSNSDDGGATYIDALDSQVLTWTDTEITVEIPTAAGTGKIRVTHNDTNTILSSTDLTITYSEINAVSNFFSVGEATDYAYQTRHINENTSGGYTWEMQTDFFNDTEFPGAKAAFERAIDTWRCSSKINWEIATSATTVDVIADDGVNVVKFDNSSIPADELPDGVAGRCTSRYSSCGFLDDPLSAEYHVTEMDIVFDEEVDWETGTALASGSKFDFESVALHELGHGHQLGHVIDATGAVMHYIITNAENIRTLTTGDEAGAADVQSRSNTIVACSKTVMTNSTTCNLSIEEEEEPTSISIFPNPTTGQIFIKTNASVKLNNAIIYDVSGRLISNIDLTETNAINLQNTSKGIYFANIYSDKGMTTKKILLQ